MPTLYQSHKPEIQKYNEEKEKKRPREQKMIFKWKMAIIVIGIIFILLIGGLSQILKAINDKKVTDYDTTFLYPLLKHTMLLDSSQDVENFLLGLNNSAEIKFDTVEKIYEGEQLTYMQFVDKISGNENLLYFWNINVNSSSELKFAFYLQKKNHFINQRFLVSEARDHKVSSVFNLESNGGRRLNLSDNCFLYKTIESGEGIRIGELIYLPMGNQNSTISLNIGNWECFSRKEEDVPSEMQKIIGYPLQPGVAEEIELKRIQVYSLQMEYDKIQI